MPGTLNGVRYFGRTGRGRYEPCSRWVKDVDASNSAADVFFADLKDKQTGDVFTAGAFKVVAKSNGKSAIQCGETAWSDAERLANDLLQAERRNPPVDGLRDLLRF